MSALQTYAQREAETVFVAGMTDSRAHELPQSFDQFAASAQTVDALADAMATPALATAWADAIVCYWEGELADGRIRTDRPIYLLDLAPAYGRLAWLMLQALEERLPGSAAAMLDFRYVACEDEEGDAMEEKTQENAHRKAHRKVHGAWTRLAAKRRFTFARWRGTVGSALLIADTELAISSAANPVVLLAPGLFERQPSRLFAAHRGKWMQGCYTREPGASSSGEQLDDALSCEWHEMRTGAMDASCEPLAVHYIAHLPSAAVLLPAVTFAMLDALSRFCGRAGYLLLATAHGVCTERQLRTNALWPSSARLHQDAPQPVNFHALAMYHQTKGAAVYARQLADHGLVAYAAWWRPSEPPPERCMATLRTCLDAHHPDDSAHLAASAEALAEVAPPEALLALLRLSRHDARVLGRLISGYGDRPLCLTDSELHAWRAAVFSVWQRHAPGVLDPMLDRQLGLLAMRVGNWGLASEIFRTGLMHNADDVAAHYYLARCLVVTGYLNDAITHAATALALDPTHRACVALCRLLRRRDASWRSLRAYQSSLARDRDLCIEPLCSGHVDALLDHLLSDPHIALMANLPDMTNRQQVLEWLDGESHEAGRCSYAVVQADQGPIGVVSYRRVASAAYFYFWVGAGVQGAGLGSRAARLLLAQAEAAGVTDMFTSTFVDNIRSSRALVRVGFEPLVVEAADDRVSYFHASLVDRGASIGDFIEQLTGLCESIDSPV
ncbi:GNAT family N-acetyltransferase [Paraburkholderia humisilvae]|uniref:N-acetyltransferase domain-containing protein n=1 Tax=Paraburkholderia humisilvae TaxID=627669 RepID=A0A6J5EXK0_9BURK|nr:GNAT family N-acetyltransferase [Paraburkholderia humisilvae]CAB3770177.1 hypothetical protein LMG29542_06289 [Paraburkholderia humisilvae]